MDQVHAFLALVGKPQTDENAEEILRKLSSMDYDAAYFNSLYEGLQVLPSAVRREMVKAGGGTYGSFYTCSSTYNICYKAIELKKESTMHNTFKELFIQAFIHSDLGVSSFIPEIHAIFSVTADTKRFLVIEMDRADITLYDLFQRCTAPLEQGGQPQQLSFEKFYKPAKRLFSLIRYLHTTYDFVHRDLKPNNVMLKWLPPDNNNFDIQLIDFGMSCINVTVNGTTYNIKSHGGYRVATPCRSEQDVLMFMWNILNDFSPPSRPSRMTAALHAFMRQIISQNTEARIRARAPNFKGSEYHAAYNRNGNLFTNRKMAYRNNLDRFLVKLDEMAAELRIPIDNTPVPAAGGAAAGAAAAAGGGGGAAAGAAAAAGGGGGGAAEAPVPVPAQAQLTVEQRRQQAISMVEQYMLRRQQLQPAAVPPPPAAVPPPPAAVPPPPAAVPARTWPLGLVEVPVENNGGRRRTMYKKQRTRHKKRNTNRRRR